MRTLPFLLHSLSVARAATIKNYQRLYSRFSSFCPKQIFSKKAVLIG